MPTRAPRLCPRCGTTYLGRCQVCLGRWQQRSRLRIATRPSPYASAKWREFSRAFLAEHRTCECPEHLRMPEILRPRSQVTDHIDGLGPNGPRGYDKTNCQAMTIVCHGRKTARQDGGFGRPRRQGAS